MRILLVEDDEDFTKIVSDTLAMARYAELEIRTAISGARGMELLNEMEFDCVLTDYYLPDCTGVEFFRSARKSRFTIPFIIMSGKDNHGLEDDFILEGLSAYIPKDNINLETMKYTLNAVLSQAREDQRSESGESTVKFGKIEEFMSASPLWISPEANIHEIISRINEAKVGSLLIGKEGDYIGIVTKRDLIRKVIARKLCHDSTTVSEIMSEIVSIDRNASTRDAKNLMQKHGIRHLAVTDNGAIAGMLSSKDIVNR